VGAAQLTSFDALVSAFDNTTTDIELQGAVSVAVQVKDATVSAIHKAVRTIRSMAEQAYEGKGKYKTFGFEDMTRLSDNDLYRMVKRVVRVATSLQADLTLQGLTANQLSDLTSLDNKLDTDIDTVHDAEEQRDLQTQDRIKKGNMLYKEMAKLASIGQSLFQDTDEAKYNDYVLIGSRAEGEGTGVSGGATGGN
jgi:hypothetical protein